VKRLLLVFAGLGTAMVSVLVVWLSTNGLLSENRGAEAQTTSRPNIVFVMTDDLDERSMEQLGGIQQVMGSNGTTFENAYVNFSLCCPSRATFLRGQYPHNHGILGNALPQGGEVKFRNLGLDKSTIATWLNSGGYQTKYIGKYMNSYGGTYVPPGWDEWYVIIGDQTHPTQARINQDGQEIALSGNSTDVFADKASDFIRRSAANSEPFFVTVGTVPPHDPWPTADRHQNSFVDTPLPRPPNFDEADVSDKPQYIRAYGRLMADQVTAMQDDYRKRLRSMLSVEDLLRQTVTTLQETGELNNTYIFFTSDNGFHLGNHRVYPGGKWLPYEEDIGVPLMVRGPGVPAGAVRDQLVINNDLAPTIAELAGVNIPSFVDGKSFVPLLSSSPPSSWRTAFLEEGWPDTNHPDIPKVPLHKSVHTQQYMFTEYDTGERELYDLSADPYQLQSISRTANSEQLYSTLESRLNALRACSGEACRSAEWGTTTPPPPPTTDTTRPRVTSTSPAANATGVAPSANVTATFSEAMMSSSINGTTFKLFKKGSTTKIGAAVSYDGATKKATLDPTNNLRLGTTYKAVVTTGAKDLASNQLDQNTTTTGLQQKTWLFTVS
jgi:N-acetylglucosamine-6-sulfatase